MAANIRQQKMAFLPTRAQLTIGLDQAGREHPHSIEKPLNRDAEMTPEKVTNSNMAETAANRRVDGMNKRMPVPSSMMAMPTLNGGMRVSLRIRYAKRSSRKLSMSNILLRLERVRRPPNAKKTTRWNARRKARAFTWSERWLSDEAGVLRRYLRVQGSRVARKSWAAQAR